MPFGLTESRHMATLSAFEFHLAAPLSFVFVAGMATLLSGGRLLQWRPAKARMWKRTCDFRIGRLQCLGSSSSAPEWSSKESPYDVLGLERNCNEDGIKIAYRRLAKLYHPDVFSGDAKLLDGETVEGRFIKVQAAYELLMDIEARRKYDFENKSNPMKASQAWMEWFVKKKQAYEQRGDLAATLWAEQQQREMNLKARQRAKHKMDPEEEKRIVAKEKRAAILNFDTTVKRHTLVLKKRDIERRKAQEKQDRDSLVQQLLAAEGLELDEDDDKNKS